MKKGMKILKSLNNIDDDLLSKNFSNADDYNIRDFKTWKFNPALVITAISIMLMLAGGVYATVKTVENTGKAKITPSYTSINSATDKNKVWIGTFNLIWNDFMNEVIKGKIEFEDGSSELADELNKQSFTNEYLSQNSYFKICKETSIDLKNEIEKEIKNNKEGDTEEEANRKLDILNKITWYDPNGYILYAILKKEFTFLVPFSSSVGSIKFNNSEQRIKCFGTDTDYSPEAEKNIEVLFYNSKEDFAIKLKTKEKEEVILYKTNCENKSFEDIFKQIENNQKKYMGERKFGVNDILRIPYIKIHDQINYDELCGRYIKNSAIYIRQAIQTVDFELNNVGGCVKSEALIEASSDAILDTKREFIFDSSFILYLKEENKEKPYFALKVDDVEILEQEEGSL